jgi:hypothetical protein
MPRAERVQILDKLQAELGMPVLTYVTGDRPNLPTAIAPDVVPLLPRHLRELGEQESIALLLYTRGGDTNMAWPIVNFMRAFCKELVVAVPFFAHSAGTLICLGADKILMSKIATLSPIDPSVANAFNPQDPANPQNRIAIAVEDVMAYFELGKAQGVKRDEDVGAAFMRLAESVHPLALGNVHRSIEQIRQLADKLIRLHSPESPAEDVGDRIRKLTTAFYTHNHLINREEAKALGLPVDTPSDNVEAALLEYYDCIADDLELTTTFDPSKMIAAGQASLQATQPGQATQPPAVHRFERGYIETKDTSDVYVTEGTISMQPQQLAVQLPPGMAPPTLPNAATFEITKDEWERVA